MTITTMSSEELQELGRIAAIEHTIAEMQSHDRAIILTDLSEYDLDHIDQIIRDTHGDWFMAHLLRTLHILLPVADQANLLKLRTAYPGACAAYLAWYNNRLDRVVKDG